MRADGGVLLDLAATAVLHQLLAVRADELPKGVSMAIGSEQRRRERRPRVEGLFAGKEVEAALDLLHLMDMAWHDCYGPQELEVPPAVLDDVLLLSDGDLVVLIREAREAVIDFRDVRIAADAIRAKSR